MDNHLADMVTRVVDLLTAQLFDKDVEEIADFWNPKGDNFDLAALLGVVDNSDLSRLLGGGNFSKEALAHLIPRLHNMKGTETGLRLFMAMIGVRIVLFPGWKVDRLQNKEAADRTTMEQNLLDDFEERFPGFLGAPIAEGVVFFDIESRSDEITAVFSGLSNTEIAEKINEIAQSFVWHCATFVSPVPIEEPWLTVVSRFVSLLEVFEGTMEPQTSVYDVLGANPANIESTYGEFEAIAEFPTDRFVRLIPLVYGGAAAENRYEGQSGTLRYRGQRAASSEDGIVQVEDTFTAVLEDS